MSKHVHVCTYVYSMYIYIYIHIHIYICTRIYTCKHTHVCMQSIRAGVRACAGMLHQRSTQFGSEPRRAHAHTPVPRPEDHKSTYNEVDQAGLSKLDQRRPAVGQPCTVDVEPLQQRPRFPEAESHELKSLSSNKMPRQRIHAAETEMLVVC